MPVWLTSCWGISVCCREIFWKMPEELDCSLIWSSHGNHAELSSFFCCFPFPSSLPLSILFSLTLYISPFLHLFFPLLQWYLERLWNAWLEEHVMSKTTCVSLFLPCFISFIIKSSLSKKHLSFLNWSTFFSEFLLLIRLTWEFLKVKCFEQ